MSLMTEILLEYRELKELMKTAFVSEEQRRYVLHRCKTLLVKLKRISEESS